MKVRAPKTRIFKEKESLTDFVVGHIASVPEKSIVVVTSKIVALAEGRTVPLGTKADKIRLIKKQSQKAWRTKYVWLTIKDGMVMANAGVDESNANGKIILLPKNSFIAARRLRDSLKKKYKVRELGVLITDSRTMLLRAGVTGVALGYAGFKGIREYRGKPDIFNRPLVMTRTDVADSLAASAVLLMGEGNEQKPLALITDAPVEFSDRINQKELHIPLDDDMYGPLFKNLKSK